jgi:hypothetical protein
VSFLTNHTYEKTEERETLYGEVVTTKSGEEDNLQNAPKGIWFGVVNNKKISKNLQLSIEFRL